MESSKTDFDCVHSPFQLDGNFKWIGAIFIRIRLYTHLFIYIHQEITMATNQVGIENFRLNSISKNFKSSYGMTYKNPVKSNTIHYICICNHRSMKYRLNHKSNRIANYRQQYNGTKFKDSLCNIQEIQLDLLKQLAGFIYINVKSIFDNFFNSIIFKN